MKRCGRVTARRLHPCVGLLCLSFAISLASGLTSAAGASSNAMRAPRGLSGTTTNQSTSPRSEVSLPAGVFDGMLQFFQQFISQVDGPRSNMYPTGSAYARQVFKKHGAFLGVLLTAERLLHEGNERQVSPRIEKYGIWRIYDPVEANDWWWGGANNWIYTPRFGPYDRR